MNDQLLNYAKDNLGKLMESIPELKNLDLHDTTKTTSKTILDEIMQQLKGGNFSGIKEMLSGNATSHDSDAVKELEKPIAEKLKNQLNVSSQTSQQIALMALPIIMNMLNGKVNTAQSNGINVQSYLNKMETGGGIFASILKLFGAQNMNPSAKIVDQLINKIM